MSVTDRLLSATEASSSAVDRGIEGTKPWELATDRAVVAADRSVVAAEPSLSAADRLLSTTEPSLSATDRGIEATEPYEVAADRSVVAAEPSLSVADRRIDGTDRSAVATSRNTLRLNINGLAMNLSPPDRCLRPRAAQHALRPPDRTFRPDFLEHALHNPGARRTRGHLRAPAPCRRVVSLYLRGSEAHLLDEKPSVRDNSTSFSKTSSPLLEAHVERGWRSGVVRTLRRSF